MRERAGVDHLDDLVGQVEQPHGVRDVGPASSDSPCEDDAGHPEVVEQDGERPGLLDRAEVLADDVLDQRQLQRPRLVERVVDERRDGRLAGELGGAPAALAGDELIAVLDRPDDDRLQHAALPDRVRQRGQRRLVEALARLSGIRADLPRSGCREAGPRPSDAAGYRSQPGCGRPRRRADRRPRSPVAGPLIAPPLREQLDDLAVGERDAAVRRQARDRHPCGGRFGDQRRAQPDPTGRREPRLRQLVLDRAATDRGSGSNA